MFIKSSKKSGIYHIKDNIDQLELLIHFRHVNSLLKLPKFDFNKYVVDCSATNGSNVHTNSILEAPIDDYDADAEDKVQIVRVKWQQKLLSPSEIELYKDIRNCVTDAQKKYYQLLQQCHSDEFENEMKHLENVSKKFKAKKRIKKTKNAEEIKRKSMQIRNNEIFTYTQEDNFVPDMEENFNKKSETKKSSSKTDEPSEIMYIYAAIHPIKQLVALKWYSQRRILLVYPDFNSFQHNPYYVEVDSDYRRLYAYALKNVSRAIPSDNYIAALNLIQLPELFPTHWQVENELATQFAMPKKRTKRILLLLEIRAAAGFEYDNIHVRFHVHLPPNTLLEEGSLESSTHSSISKGSQPSLCHFNYNWQITILCEETFDSANLFHIYFEVVSIDSWDRERTEGYAHYSTYLDTGCDHLHLQCLRPTDSFLNVLNRYFIGGRQKFNFVEFFSHLAPSVPPRTAQTVHSRLGCRMQSTGQLEIKCQRLLQRSCELLEPCKSRTSGMTLDDIMLAYREARRRLEAMVV